MTESKDKRKGWIADLKVGDEVYEESGYGEGRYDLQVVVSISPTGRITVSPKDKPDRKTVFPHNGSIFGGAGGSVRLVQKTEALANRLYARNLIYTCQNVADGMEKRIAELRHYRSRHGTNDVVKDIENFKDLLVSLREAQTKLDRFFPPTKKDET